MSTDIEGEQYYRDITALQPENRVELMLDMVYAVEKALDDISKKTPSARIDDALVAVDDLYEVLKRLNPQEVARGEKEK